MGKRKAATAMGLALVAAGLVPAWRDEIAARLVHGSRHGEPAIDALTRTYEWTREVVALGLLSDQAQERLTELRYRSYPWYSPKDDTTWEPLFDWETAFAKRYLPQDPCRVLIGGSGAGREAYHMSRRGHDVVAFDPIPQFVETMARSMSADLRVHPYRARYQDLPRLNPATPNHPAGDLSAMPPFDAAILGWSSFSHILDEDASIETLRTMARHVHGPILVSFFTRDPEEDTHWSSQIRRRIPGRNGDPSFAFRMYSGVFRAYIAAEIFELCNRADVSVIEARVLPVFNPSSYIVVQGQAEKPRTVSS